MGNENGGGIGDGHQAFYSAIGSGFGCGSASAYHESGNGVQSSTQCPVDKTWFYLNTSGTWDLESLYGVFIGAGRAD